MKPSRGTICIDFDGVIHDYAAGWTGYVPEGAPVPGALAFVESLRAEGWEIIISSCRAYTQIGREAMRDWLNRNGFPYLSVTCEKAHADHYIDDRAIRFNGCWDEVRVMMQQPVWFKVGREPRFEG